MKEHRKKALIWMTSIGFVLVMLVGACLSSSGTIVIHYAAWNLGDERENGLERRMIHEFMKEYPKIKVEIEEGFVKNYNTAMKEADEKSNIPDVFMYAGNPQADENGWCLDLTEITTKDPEWSNIPIALRDSTRVKGRIIAVPTAMYFNGYFYNSRIFKDSSVQLPKIGMSLMEFENAVKACTNIEEGQIGLGDENSICEWYPASVSNNYGWYSWDGGKFNLNSIEFKAGIRLAKAFNVGKYSYAFLDEQDKKKLHGTNDWEAWNAGTVAMKFDGTWSVSAYSKLPYEIGFAGIPGGRTCIVPDYMFVAKNTEHPKEAYQFIKFMSAYSVKGFSKRLELADQHSLVVSTMPMLKDEKILDQYFSSNNMKGIREAYSKLNNGCYVEGTKVLPGYSMARWEYKTNIIIGKNHNVSIGEVLQNTFRGNISIDDVADQLNYLANTCIKIYPQQLGN